MGDTKKIVIIYFSHYFCILFLPLSVQTQLSVRRGKIVSCTLFLALLSLDGGDRNGLLFVTSQTRYENIYGKQKRSS
jgi:hypothetical protein